MDAMYLGYAALLMLAVCSLLYGCNALLRQGATS
jgi:hypothetical protein